MGVFGHASCPDPIKTEKKKQYLISPVASDIPNPDVNPELHHALNFLRSPEILPVIPRGLRRYAICKSRERIEKGAHVC